MSCHVGAGTQTLILCKISQCSHPLGRPSSLCITILLYFPWCSFALRKKISLKKLKFIVYIFPSLDRSYWKLMTYNCIENYIICVYFILHKTIFLLELGWVQYIILFWITKKNIIKGWVELANRKRAYLACMEPNTLFLASYKLGTTGHVCNPSTKELCGRNDEKAKFIPGYPETLKPGLQKTI